MRHLTICLLTGCALCGATQAQRLATYAPTSGGIVELQPPTPLLPTASPPLLGYPTVPVLGPIGAPFGDSTFDNLLGLHWFTEGTTLASMPTPTFPPLGPVTPPMPIPQAVFNAIGGPVSGIALDPLAGIMFLTGPPGMVVGVLPVAGMPIVVAPFPIPFLLAPIAGLEWDSATGSLYAVDLGGTTYNFLPGGGPIGLPMAPPIPMPGPAGDVAIDRTLRANAWGFRPLYVVAGSVVFDVREAVPTVFPAGPFASEGLAFVNHPAANPPTGACLCPGTTFPTLKTTSVMTAGNGAFSIVVGGLPPGFPAVFAFDTAMFNPSLPWINAVGCGLGIVPGSATIILFSAFADGAGNAVLPLPLAFPVGTGPFYNQNATFCQADPFFGLVFTPMQTVYVPGV